MYRDDYFEGKGAPVRLIVVHLGAFQTIEDALDWAHAQGEVVRVTLDRAPDGTIRGSVLLKKETT